MKKLMLVSVLFLCFGGLAKADEFEGLVEEIRYLSGANTTSMVLLDSYLAGNRGLMSGFLKYELALEGKQTSNAKINDLLDKWQEAYVAAVPKAVAEIEMQYFRQQFTLNELKQIRDILSDPIMRKLTVAGFPPNRYSIEILAELERLNASIMKQLEDADPDWWKLGEAESPETQLADAKVLNFTKEWMKFKDAVTEYPDNRWHLIDEGMAEFVIKGGLECKIPEKQAAVVALQAMIIDATRADHAIIMNQVGSELLMLRNERGVDIAATRHALLEAAYLSARDEGIVMLYNDAFNMDDTPRCENIEGWADGLLAKAEQLEKIRQD
ncbi:MULTISPECIES: hypothetical protein [Kordiimonas]|jgi:hypothetical protein|uniref:hypothetical protein n=1 Tax=Kordiimonas TaxID=288021 RepID=UPI00257EA29B|nr:hypothetical protein [Kordiimonas sp. UBA4487]